MIKKINVNWHEGWANSAGFEILFENLKTETPYRKVGNTYLSIAPSGYANFWVCDVAAGNNKGCGGREVPITMEDGSKVSLMGPWSSSSDWVNEAFGDLLVTEASVTDDPIAYERGYTFCSAAVSVQALVDYVKANPDCGFRLGLVKVIGGTYVLPLKMDGSSKHPNDVVERVLI